MQFGGNESLAGTAFPFDRADTQVWDSALHLLEKALNGWRSSDDGRMTGGKRLGCRSRLLSLRTHCRLTGKEDARDDAQEFAGADRWIHDCGIYRQPR